jgi:hypothetical protein
MMTRVVGTIVMLAIGIGALWVAFTGKSVYSGPTSGSHREPMPPKEGRTMATMVGVFFLLFALWFFFAG